MNMIRYDSFSEATIVPFCWSGAETSGSAAGDVDAEDTRRRWGIRCEEPSRKWTGTAAATDVRLCRGATVRRMGCTGDRLSHGPVSAACWTDLMGYASAPSKAARIIARRHPAGVMSQRSPRTASSTATLWGQNQSCDCSSSIPTSPGASPARVSLRRGCRTSSLGEPSRRTCCRSPCSEYYGIGTRSGYSRAA